uniref:Uncharacterized protein n=1 Tax=Ascaris lumbricoides TaxID=6252 RepID=A0A0M3IFU9_ASCLU
MHRISWLSISQKVVVTKCTDTISVPSPNSLL